MASREPTYITSLIAHKPMEMVTPRKVALLVFLERGWIWKLNSFHLPLKFKSLIQKRDAPEKAGFWHRRHSIMVNQVTATDLAFWCQLKIVRRTEAINCVIRKSYQLTPAGLDFLRNVSPEVLSEARAVYRAHVWKNIVSWRRERDRERAWENERRAAAATKKAKKVKAT